MFYSTKSKFLSAVMSFAAVIYGVCAIISPVNGFADTPPKIFGVTNGSVYKEYVNPRWYDTEATATLSTNSGVPAAFSSGTRISSNGQYELTVSNSDGQTTVFFEIDTATSASLIYTNEEQAGTRVDIEFSGGTYAGNPLFAIWAEDINGNLLQNIYVSAVPATNIMRFGNNLVRRPQALPFWAHKHCIEKEYGSADLLYLAEPDIPVPADLDGVTGATQKSGFQICSNIQPNTINDSRVKIFFEINQSFDDGWYFYGSNAVHEEEGTGTFASDKFFYGSEEPAIVYCAEIDLNQADTITFGGNDGLNDILPIGYSHYAGRTGTLYTDFFADDNGVQRYKFDHAHQMVSLVTATTIPGQETMHIGDFNRDQDVDGSDLTELTGHPDLIASYISEFASNFGI